MAPRANWKGFLRLSLVTCPVALYPATSESEKVSFNQLNRKTGHLDKYAQGRRRHRRRGGQRRTSSRATRSTPTFVRRGDAAGGNEEEARGGRAGIHAHHRDRRVRGEVRDRPALPDPALLYLRPGREGSGHDAFAVIRETIREMNKVAIGRVVLTNREHIIALEPLEKGLMGTLLRYPYEVRSEEEYFDEIEDVKVTKDMLNLARHIVNQKSRRSEKFEDHYETALVDLINSKRSGKPITPKERPRGENVVDLMDALRKSVGGAAAETKAPKKSAKKPRKAAAGQKEMLMPIAGKKQAKETAAKKPAARSQRKSA